MKKVEYQFMVNAKVTAEADFVLKQSAVKHVEIHLTAKGTAGKHWKDKNGSLTPAGFKAQTQGFVQGLIANIHSAHQIGAWDSAEHLRYIIKNIEHGFALASVKVEETEM